jgi:hypothetical protein
MLEIIAAARSLSVTGQPMRQTDRPTAFNHEAVHWPSV